MITANGKEVVLVEYRKAIDPPPLATQSLVARLAHVDGTSISVTQRAAPLRPRRLSKRDSNRRKKANGDAQKSFEKAVQIYPRYATAWYQLGRLQLRNQLLNQSQSQLPNQLPNDGAQSAKHSFEQSVAADPKYVNPYDGLAQLLPPHSPREHKS